MIATMPAQAPTAAPGAPRRRRPAWTYWREYLSIAPFFVLFAGFGIFPLGYAAYLGTQAWDGLGPSVFVGFDQVTRLMTDPQLGEALFNTVVIFLMGQIPVIVGALVAATILSRPKMRGKGFYQALLFTPQMTSLVAVAIVFQSFFSNDYGLINYMLHGLGLGEVPWMSDPWLMKLVVATTVIWRGLGYFLLVFLAGMAAIPRELYDAATVDGAGPVRTFWSVTLPMLRPTILFVALTGTIGGFQMFTEPRVLFGGSGGPDDGALTLMLMQVQYMGSGATGRIADLGYATVIGWAVLVILVVVAVFNRRFLRLGESD